MTTLTNIPIKVEVALQVLSVRSGASKKLMEEAERVILELLKGGSK